MPFMWDEIREQPTVLRGCIRKNGCSEPPARSNRGFARAAAVQMRAGSIRIIRACCPTLRDKQ